MLSIVSALTVDTETIAAIIDDFLPLIADKIT